MSDMNTQDWFGLVYDNQSATAKDFLRNGIDSSQVSLKSKDYYKNQESVQEAFKGEDGKFDENAFNDFYKNASIAYNSLSNTTFEESQLPDIEYDIMSTLPKPGDKRQDITLDIINLKNPFLATKGLKGIYGTTYIDMSNRELAQSQKIWDSKNEQWLDETPEDKGFWGTTFGTPLALAQYDEETITTDENGRRIKHEKGELKLNEDGLPYYETIENNRSTRGRQVLTSWDVLTREDSVWNKYDFMDNDGLDKSITGTVMQTVASIAPLFIPGVGAAYTYALTARELAKLTATLGKMVDGIFNPNATDADYPWLNALENHASKFSTSVSDASQKDIFTLENFGKLASDVATQLFQQRALAEIPRKLGLASPQQAALKSIRNTYGDDVAKQVFDGDIIKNESVYNALVYSNPEIRDAVTKAITRNNLYGKTLSTLYMAGTSTMDVFNDALDAGYDRRTAAFTAALAMGATFGMMNKYDIGQVALQGMGFNEERHALKAAVNGFLKEAKEELSDVVTNKKLSLKTFKGLMGKLNDIYDKAGRTIAKGGYIGSALGEGIEEVTEEAIMDVSKEITDAINYMFDVNPDAEFKFTESNPFERYLMSAIGGAVGGAIFRGLNRTSDINKNIPNDTKEHLMYLLRNGKKQDVIKELERLRKRGVASKTLSTRISDYDASNNPIFEQALDNKDSQNDALIDLAEQTVEEWDAIINQEGLNINDDDLFTRSTLQDKRIKDLINFSGKYDLFQDFNSKAVKIAKKAIRRKDIERELSENSSNNTTALQTELSTINADIATLKAEKDELLSGAKTQEYIEKSLFNLSDISNPFYARDIYAYTRQVFKKNYNQLSEGEKEEINARYELYKNDEKSKFNDAFIAFKNMASATQSDILRAASIYPELDAIKAYLNEEERQKLLELDEDAISQYEQNKDSDSLARSAFEMILNPSSDIGEDFSEVLVDYFLENYEGLPFYNDAEKQQLKDRASAWVRDNIMTGNVEFTTQNLIRAIEEVIGENKYTTKGYKEVINSSTDINNDPAVKAYVTKQLTKLDTKVIQHQKTKRIFEILDAANNDNVKLTKDIYNYLEQYIVGDSNFRVEMSRDALKEYLENYIPNDFDSEALYKDDSGNIKESFLDAMMSADSMYDVADYILKNIQDKVIDEYAVTELSYLFQEISPSTSEFDLLKLKNLQRIKGVQSKLVNNPLIDILDNLVLDVEGVPNPIKIFELLANEGASLKSLNTISEYVLQDKIKASQLEAAIHTIDMIMSVVQSMLDASAGNVLYGYNQVINEFNKNNPKLGIKDNPNFNTTLGTINRNIAGAMLDDLNNIKKQLNFFINLSNKNKGNLLKEHVLTAINTNKALLKIYTDKRFTDRVPELFNDNFKSVIAKYAPEFERLQNLTPSDKEGYVLLEKVIGDINDALYEIAETNNLNKKDILDKLFGAYNYYDDLNKTTYNLPAELGIKLENFPVDILYSYMHAILVLKDADFSKALIDTFNEELNSNDGSKKPFMPIFSQEFATRLLLAYIKDPTTMSHIVDPEYKHVLTNIKGIDYYGVKLPNFIFINGAPGVGKTQGVAKLAKRMSKHLNLDLKYVVAGPEKSQTINLYNGLFDTEYDKDSISIKDIAKNDTQNAITTSTDLIKSILATEYKYLADSISKISYDSKDSTVKPSNLLDTSEGINNLNPKLFTETKAFLGGSSDQLFDTTAFNDQKVIVIDEATYITRAQMELLARFSQLTGKVILGLGDLLQSGYINKNNVTFNIDSNTNYCYSPTLAQSLRIANIHQKDNTNIFRTITEATHKTYGASSDEDAKSLLEKYKMAPALKYYQDDNVLHGTKISEELQESDLQVLLKAGKSIIYIYDNETSPTYSKLKVFSDANPGKIKFRKLKDVQGDESTYVIIDLHLNYENKSDRNNIENSTKKLYTAVTRAKDGGIIINNNFTSWWETGCVRMDYTADAIISSKAAKEFTEWRLEALGKRLEGAKFSGSNTHSSSSNFSSSSGKNTLHTTPTKDEKSLMTEAFIGDIKPFEDKDTVIRKPLGDEVGKKDGFTFYSYASRIGLKPKNNSKTKYYFGHTSSVTNNGNFIKIPENTDLRILLEDSTTDSIDAEDLLNTRNKISLINNIKSILLNKISVENRKASLRDLDENFNTILESVGKVKVSSLADGKFQLKLKESESRTSKYNELTLVYSIPYNSSEGNGFYDIEICSGPNPNKDISKLSEEQKKYYAKYKEFFNTIIQNKNPYVELRDDFTIDRISNSIIWKDTSKKDDKSTKTFITLDEAASIYPELRFSKPYIFTKDTTDTGLAMQNMESRSSKEVSKLKSSYLKGKAVVFVTHDTNLYNYDTDTRISEDGYMTYYIDQLNGKYDDNPEMRDKIRMLVLNPVGISFREFLNKYTSYVEKSYNDNTIRFYKSFMGDYTGHDILYSIIKYQEHLTNKTSRTDTENAKLNFLNTIVTTLKNFTYEEQEITNKVPLEKHIARVLKRITESFDNLDNERKKFRGTTDNYNGADVMYYIYLINKRISQGKEYSGLNPLLKGKSIMPTFEDIDSDFFIDTISEALTGKIGDTKIEGYNAIFPEGIFPFPVYTSNKADSRAGNMAYEALDLGNMYYIDRDIQPPRVYISLSRDLKTPEAYSIKKSEVPKVISTISFEGNPPSNPDSSMPYNASSESKGESDTASWKNEKTAKEYEQEIVTIRHDLTERGIDIPIDFNSNVETIYNEADSLQEALKELQELKQLILDYDTTEVSQEDDLSIIPSNDGSFNPNIEPESGSIFPEEDVLIESKDSTENIVYTPNELIQNYKKLAGDEIWDIIENILSLKGLDDEAKVYNINNLFARNYNFEYFIEEFKSAYTTITNMLASKIQDTKEGINDLIVSMWKTAYENPTKIIEEIKDYITQGMTMDMIKNYANIYSGIIKFYSFFDLNC